MDDGNLTDGQGNVINFKIQLLFVHQMLALAMAMTLKKKILCTK